jgi:hypothetical protein
MHHLHTLISQQRLVEGAHCISRAVRDTSRGIHTALQGLEESDRQARLLAL